ncbi:hypothetical protein BDY21DRAFT_295480 [Lineolata rhizophorae]|uniref:DUF1989 domain-containing protein n=1 Tax=Lineolata rhizophorae TaxID=578093 RepID=A0A6A6PF51_9PEZI|nr:hypothetical protein BDY21DRAFT_295480 [Lineolata rhizophorae]
MSPSEKSPQPAYLPGPNSILHPPTALYERIEATAGPRPADGSPPRPRPDQRVLIYEHMLAPRSGVAFRVPTGSVFRLSTPEGAQVGDLNVWNGDDPRERFWAARTRQLQRSHVRWGDRLWSCLPFMRPLCGVVGDSLGGYGKDRWGGMVHDLLGTRCDPYVNKMLTGDSYDYQCHSNLVRAVLPFGLTEFDVHDVLNVFQVTGLDDQGRYFMEASPATERSYIEFFAEQNLLCALSTCPGGDLSAWQWGEGGRGGGSGEGTAAMRETCRALKIEVWSIAEGVRDEVLAGWAAPGRADYRGMHGMEVPAGEGSPPRG